LDIPRLTQFHTEMNPGIQPSAKRDDYRLSMHWFFRSEMHTLARFHFAHILLSCAT